MAREKIRQRFVVRGAVQGVGFRPFVYRLAAELKLAGFVLNSEAGVVIEIEGPPDALRVFEKRLRDEKPAPAILQSVQKTAVASCGDSGFEIRHSEKEGRPKTLVMADLATCGDCRLDMGDPKNRRYRYPFTNCTNCGPRFSIVESIPYDRPNTSMKKFRLCRVCQAEYDDPANRRFHAQPNACPECGPQLAFWDAGGKRVAEKDRALLAAAGEIRRGRIVAVKGIGGFHLMCDARNENAVNRLRERKHREQKPFAVMFRDLEQVNAYARSSRPEARWLGSSEAPIVLLEKRESLAKGTIPISASVAPDNPLLGCMLAYSPLHILLLSDLGFPLVATSGNVSDEPICFDEKEAVVRLAGIADAFLVHDRPVVRPVDDSVGRMIEKRLMVLRRARGFAPLPVEVGRSVGPAIALGGHLKNTVAIADGKNVFISQHLGDLETLESTQAFLRSVTDLQNLFEIRPERAVCDLHPDYRSGQEAEKMCLPVVRIQHHLAHAWSAMAENRLEPPVLAVCWDGTGFGTDRAIWGGEFLHVDPTGFFRAGHLRAFRLPGGGAAVREPWRCAMGVLFEVFGKDVLEANGLRGFRRLSAGQQKVFVRMLSGSVAPWTTSAGRLFDAVAALSGLMEEQSFEGQAAMGLEFALSEKKREVGDAGAYELALTPPAENTGGSWVLDWEPMIRGVLEDQKRGAGVELISARFHRGLSNGVVRMAEKIGEKNVVLSGGCFQNRFLAEETIAGLRAKGFNVYWHQFVPPNDGGLSLGQLMAAQYDDKLQVKKEDGVPALESIPRK